jgi:hypothetical protein
MHVSSRLCHIPDFPGRHRSISIANIHSIPAVRIYHLARSIECLCNVSVQFSAPRQQPELVQLHIPTIKLELSSAAGSFTLSTKKQQACLLAQLKR